MIEVIIADAGVRASDLRCVQTGALGSIVYAYDTDRVIVAPEYSLVNTFLPLATVWRHAREAGVAPVFDIPFVDATHEMLDAANEALCDSDALPYTRNPAIVWRRVHGYAVRVYTSLPRGTARIHLHN